MENLLVAYNLIFLRHEILNNQLEKLEAARSAYLWLPYLALLGVTRPYYGLLGLTQPYSALLGLTWPYSASLGLTRPHSA